MELGNGLGIKMIGLHLAEMKKAGDAGDATSANFFQLCYIFLGFTKKRLHNFAYFCTILLRFCAFFQNFAIFL